MLRARATTAAITDGTSASTNNCPTIRLSLLCIDAAPNSYLVNALADAVSHFATSHDRTIDALLQVNVVGELVVGLDRLVQDLAGSLRDVRRRRRRLLHDVARR